MIGFVVILAAVAAASALPVTRLVNGTIVHDGEFPFMVSLRDKGGIHMCGGSVIHYEWVLTAAHCLNGVKAPKDISIQYGVTHISKEGLNVVNVSEMVIHPEFDEENTYFADIALLKLSRALPYSRMVKPVPLPLTKQYYIAGGSPATVLGWGFNASSNGMLQEQLKKVDYFIVDHEECVDIHYHDVQDNQICAGLPEGGKGQCIGDSGGPLVSNGVQVGIVSWSVKPCGVAPYPGVFTDVSQFITWIVDVTGELTTLT